MVKGVPEHFIFRTQVKGEIGLIKWIGLNEIPTKATKQTSKYKNCNFTNVHRFLPELRRWIEVHRANTTDGLDFAAPEFLAKFKDVFTKKVYFYKRFRIDSERVITKMNAYLT